MSEGIIVAIIAAGASVLGSIIASRKSMSDIQQQIRVNQAVTDTKIDELTREVREHNNFARRMPVVEEQIRVANHRIDDLECFHKPQ